MGDQISTRPRRYFGFHYLLLRCTGLGWWHHPDEGDSRNFPGWYLYYSIATQVIWVAGFVGLETIDPFVGEKELDSFMFSLSFVITHNLTVIKLYLFFFRNQELQDIVRTIEIDLHDYYQNEDKNRRTIKICKTFTYAFIFFGWLTIGNSNTYGAITHTQPIYIPWDYQKDQSYIPTFILELVGLLWTGHIVMGIDTFIGSVILHMSSQFAILREAIETAYDRTMIQLREGTLYDVNENLPSDGADIPLMNLEENNERIVRAFYTEKQIESALQTTLVNCIRQHQVLIGCVEKFSNTYSYGFMTQLLSSMAAICVVMVQVSQDASSFKSLKLITSLAFFAAMIIQLAIQCFTGNELTLQMRLWNYFYKETWTKKLVPAKGALGGLSHVCASAVGEEWRRVVTRNTIPDVKTMTTVKSVATEEKKNTVAARISDAVMRCKWERLTPRTRSLLVMTMMRAQRPLRLSAAGFAHMDNDCFLAIMKAAYSYYAVLSQKQV